MFPTFEESFEAYIEKHGKAPICRLTKGTLKKTVEFAIAVSTEKAKERHHQLDPTHRHKRQETGMQGELAVEALIRESFVNWEIGESIKFAGSDLKRIGIKAGVKTVEFGKFPLVLKRPKEPEIIVVKERNTFHVLGLATPAVMTKHSSIKGVLTPNILDGGKKTAFYGFEHVQPFRNAAQLRYLLEKIEKRAS